LPSRQPQRPHNQPQQLGPLALQQQRQWLRPEPDPPGRDARESQQRKRPIEQPPHDPPPLRRGKRGGKWARLGLRYQDPPPQPPVGRETDLRPAAQLQLPPQALLGPPLPRQQMPPLPPPLRILETGRVVPSLLPPPAVPLLPTAAVLPPVAALLAAPAAANPPPWQQAQAGQQQQQTGTPRAGGMAEQIQWRWPLACEVVLPRHAKPASLGEDSTEMARMAAVRQWDSAQSSRGTQLPLPPDLCVPLAAQAEPLVMPYHAVVVEEEQLQEEKLRAGGWRPAARLDAPWTRH
jgi:hypothetical protein